MARPGLTQHRKFLRLARLVGSAPMALGCLELMWEKCYQNGDPFLGDVIDVEAAAQWPGEPGALCRALMDAGGEDHPGFIEGVEGRPGHYQCHDLFDHAPRYVGKRLQREMARKEQGRTLSEMRSDAGRKGATSSKRAASEQQVNSKRAANDAPPAPAPAPAPKKEYCAEPDKSDSTPVVLGFPVAGSGGKTWPVTEGRIKAWSEAFPGVNILAEVRKMLLWLNDPKNISRRKTARGYGTFAMGWLERAQNDGGSRASPGRVMPLRPSPGSQGPSPFPPLPRIGEA